MTFRSLRAAPLAALLVAALAWTPACGDDCVSEGAGPNVVVLVIDTLRADRLPFYGYGVDTAPFLSTLAESGVVFERAWSTSSWTAPATASLFTGLYPSQHGVKQGIKLVQEEMEKDPTLVLNRIPRELATLPEVMRSHGYRTFGISDNPNICLEEGFEDGFCRFQNYNYAKAPAVNKKLAEWKDEIRSGGKWFVYLHYMDPHHPYMARAPWYRAPGPVQPPETAPREELKPWVDALYDSEIAFADDHIRRAFDMLGVDEQTVVLFVADHGEELLQRSDVLQHDFKLYSELTRIPLVVVHPGVTPVRKRVAHNVSIVDVLPTLREVLGWPESGVDVGRSLVPYYTQAEEPANDRAIFAMRSQLEKRGGAEILSVVHGDLKLIRTTHPEHGEQLELYDLALDWPELENRVEREGRRAVELSELWEAFARSAKVYDPASASRRFTDEDIRKIDELGYGDTADDEHPPR